MTAATANNKCAQCDAEISANALWGLCTKCLYDEANKLPVTDGALNLQSRRFGDYDLGEALGRGGMGVVYEAMQRSLHRQVALKMILDAEAASPTSLRRFTLEAEAAAKLDHPNIVPIYEVGEHHGQPFLSMKLITGENLRKKIAGGDLCLTPRGEGTSRTTLRERAVAIVQLVATVARAVHHAHENGVLHRDLKPGNIIVDRSGQPHLTDFGLAKMMELDASEPERAPLTVSGTALGTPSYMSPEQAAGHRLSVVSDVYSLGAILYEMLTGKPPFQAGTLLETLRLVAEQEAKRPSLVNPRIDRDLDTICMKCLEKNPETRFPTAEALADDLERWLRHEPIRARPAGFALRTRRWIARNRLGTALIGSLCAGLIVALVLLELALARQHKLDLHRANSVQRFSRNVENMWKDPEQHFVLIPSSDLAELANLAPRPADPATYRLTFGMSINDEPLGQALQHAPFLYALEQRLELALHRPVRIDLRLSKSETNSLRALVRGNLDFQRMGPLRYVLARQETPALTAVVRERSQKEAVIFARKDSGITNLAQASGKRVAFGPSNSAVSFWTKVHLVRAGIRGSNLQSYIHLGGARQQRKENPSLPKGSEDRDSDTQAYKQVIQEVALGHADIGEAPRRYFELYRYRRRGLVELESFRVNSDVYVARPDLDPTVVAALRETLVSFQGPADDKMLARLNDHIVVTGFDPIADHDFDEIRAAASREVVDFERSVPRPLGASEAESLE